MKKLISKKKIIIAALILILSGAFAMTGCECSVSTANVQDVKICTSLSGNLCNQDSPTLGDTSPTIYVSCLLKNSVSATKVKFTWMYYGDTKIKIDDVTLDTGELSGTVELNSYLSRPTNGWPKGVYEVEIQILTDNAKPVLKQFTIN
ncbi:MAG: hypothetical protein CVU13_11655 [Bacteroidetes bacterium HGW-Bacteroidetes-8]|jgi:hypothetical protein|nr:MAG: hypothetical protein CVU13_11655 [Bacteroidetes bacterium HGW-Bacteroidetes-8]